MPLALNRARGETVAAGRVLTRLAIVFHRLGDPRSEDLFAEAVELLETQPPGPELVAAFTYASGRACSRTSTPRRSPELSGRLCWPRRLV